MTRFSFGGRDWRVRFQHHQEHGMIVGTVTGASLPYRGFTRTFLQFRKPEGCGSWTTFYNSTAYCSAKEPRFVKAVGREVALGRMQKKLSAADREGLANFAPLGLAVALRHAVTGGCESCIPLPGRFDIFNNGKTFRTSL